MLDHMALEAGDLLVFASQELLELDHLLLGGLSSLLRWFLWLVGLLGWLVLANFDSRLLLFLLLWSRLRMRLRLLVVLWSLRHLCLLSVGVLVWLLSLGRLL